MKGTIIGGLDTQPLLAVKQITFYALPVVGTQKLWAREPCPVPNELSSGISTA